MGKSIYATLQEMYDYNRYGDVTVRVPSNSSFVVNARTLAGQVDSEFDELKIIRSDGGSSASGQVGVAGGRQITISVRSGILHCQREVKT